MNRGTYYFPRNRTYQPVAAVGGGGGSAGLPTYTNIDLSLSDYTMTGEGIYEITGYDFWNSHNLIFPDPTLSEGCLIVVINTLGDGIPIDYTNQPSYSGGSGYVNYLDKGTLTQFVSINSRWYTSN